MPTKRQNLRALLNGEQPAWVPCYINFKQWYEHHRTNNTLPPELSQAPNFIAALKVAGCDIFTRNEDAGVHDELLDVEVETAVEQGQQGPRRITTVHTPYGDLRNSNPESTGAGYTLKHRFNCPVHGDNLKPQAR